MHLDRDEFAVTYNSSETTTDALIKIIKDAGYTAQIITAKTMPKGERSSAVPTDLEPLASALRESKAKRKPLLLDFYASWCAPCRRMENETFTDKQVAALLDEFIVLKIDTDEHVKLTESFGVAGLPDIRLMSADGQRQKQLQGFQAVGTLVSELETFLAGAKP